MRDNAFFRREGGSARRARTMLVGVVAAISFVGACDGSNLFDEDFTGGSGSGGTPPTVAIVVPVLDDRYHRGDAVRVEARLADDGGVASVTLEGLAFTGDPTLGTDEIITRYTSQTVALAELPRDTLLLRDLFPVNSADTTTAIHVIVTARDEAGNVGSDTVRIQAPGGPDVDIEFPIADGTPLVAGLDQPVRIRATDEDQITSVYLVAGGIVTDTLRFPPFSPPEATVELDTVVSLPPQAGTLTLQAFAVNTLGVTGASRVMSYPVAIPTGPDEQPPSVRLAVAGRSRMELGDEIEVHVGARDDGGSGLARVGVTVLAVNTARTDTMAVDTIVDFATPRGSTEMTFGFRPFNVDSLALPDTLLFEVHAFAVDANGQEACAVSTTYEQLGCMERAFPAGSANSVTLASGATGQLKEVIVVSGRTVLLPDGGQIADATVDTIRRRLYLSNFSAWKVDVLDMDSDSFDPDGVPVGAKPWGIALNRTEDTLIVANSGGTNISSVPLDGVLQEDGSKRLRTPNIVLYQIKEDTDSDRRRRYTYVGRGNDDFISFSDRPQFVTQDSTGLILYSTVPTSSTLEGTIRYVDADPVPAVTTDIPEAKLLFNGKSVAPNPDNVVIAHVDSLLIVDAPDDLVIIWDHVYGFPDSVIVSDVAEISAAVQSLAARGSDVYARLGTWVLEEIGMSDTTFLATAGDRSKVAFGDGATAPFAQIIMWDAGTRAISSDINVSDLIENAAERVRGIGLSQNGSLGVAKGTEGVYFFDPDLRHQGEVVGSIVAGGSGAVLHPAHPDYETLTGTNDRTIAFVGTGRKSILIVDTWHFRDRGEIQIRDNVAGPLRATLPLPADLNDPACIADAQQCVVVKLFGVTEAGGVAIVDVRRRDILDL